MRYGYTDRRELFIIKSLDTRCLSKCAWKLSECYDRRSQCRIRAEDRPGDENINFVERLVGEFDAVLVRPNAILTLILSACRHVPNLAPSYLDMHRLADDEVDWRHPQPSKKF